MTTRVTFDSEGIDLVGDLRTAPDTDGRAAPAVVLTGPFTGVKEQVVGTYADRLTAAGITTLAFDHRGFGESGGRRGHEDTQGKLADLRAAVTALAASDQVDPDRIGVVGVCLGGGYAVRAAATDPRLHAAVGIAGAYNSPARFAAGMGIANYRGALASMLAHYDDTLPAVAPDGGEAAMGGEEPWTYYGTERGHTPTWRNEVTRGSLHSLMTFDALGAADLLGDTPLLVIHGRRDDYCSPELASAVVERSPGPATLTWLDASEHIDLYDREPWVTDAVTGAVEFLHHHLG
ncbi:alpha/beta hydrolase [Nocardioides limicola]|uniref:alpha/beta hydrolase n=1 Tax=Nocardioides limicola TaxID=2803368 RepID=UPI00193C57B6|nr:alpha/beta hydrolase [Nocardioides sp. DJM-14]